MMKVKKSVIVLMAAGFMFQFGGCLNLNRIASSVVEHYVVGFASGFLPDPNTLLGGGADGS